MTGSAQEDPIRILGAMPSASPAPQVVQLEPLIIRAAVRSINADARTAEVVISTGARVLRNGWDGRFYEELSLKRGHVRMNRLNNGAPLLDSHGGLFGPSLDDQIGVVESARLEEGQMVGVVRFARAEDDPKADKAFRKVVDGIHRNISVGYRTYKLEKVEGGDSEIPVFRAVDWEPSEVSLVPMGADDGAKVRHQDETVTNQCVVVNTRAGAHAMEERDQSEFIAEQTPVTPPVVEDPAEPNLRDVGAAAERDRITGILTACRAARLPQAMADKMINDKLALVDAQRKVFEELSKRDMAQSGPRPGSGPSIQMGPDDPLVHKRKGIENALLHRMAPELFKLEDHGREYRGLAMLDTARVFLNAAGVRTTSYSKNELLDVALNVRGAGLHTTADFANLLADLPGKILLAAYREAPQKFEPIVRRITLADFKPARLLQIGEAPALLEVLEHGEVQAGTIGESKEQFQLLTYSRKFGITRRALVNDDTDAFSRLPIAMGRQVRKLESDLVWAQITANAAMGDGVALFHATHGNLSGTSDAIAVAPIGAARTAMRLQKGIDGSTLIEAEPKYLIVPVTKETLADQFVSVNLMASQSSQVNPFAGKLQVIAEPRLDAASTVSWYIASSPDQVEIIVVATLEGQEGPRVESRAGFDIEGIETKVTHDFAAKVGDWRGLYKNPGA